MTVNEWFDNGCEYNEGVMLYMKQKGHSGNLVRLFLKKYSLNNQEKLEYELSKYRKSQKTKTTKAIILEKPSLYKITPSPVIKEVDTKITKEHAHYFYRLNQLPIELHALAIQQRNDFQTAISLKLQLNNLHPLEEGKALTICLAIEELFDSIEMAQNILKHYVKHKVIIDTTKRDFSKLTGDQRIIRLRNKRSSIAKLEKRIKGYSKALLNELPIDRKTKLKIQLQKSSENLLKQQIEVQELLDYINNKS